MNIKQLKILIKDLPDELPVTINWPRHEVKQAEVNTLNCNGKPLKSFVLSDEKL